MEEHCRPLRSTSELLRKRFPCGPTALLNTSEAEIVEHKLIGVRIEVTNQHKGGVHLSESLTLALHPFDSNRHFVLKQLDIVKAGARQHQVLTDVACYDDAANRLPRFGMIFTDLSHVTTKLANCAVVTS